MRGDDRQQEGMFSYVSPEKKRARANHPLRAIRSMVDETLKERVPLRLRSCIPRSGVHRLRPLG